MSLTLPSPQIKGQKRSLTVAWISYFPVEWLPDVPESVQKLPRLHPAPWQRVLLHELQACPELKLHVLVVRKSFERHFSFERQGVTFHCLKAPGGWRRPSLFWVDTLLIRRRLCEVRPDLVHAWGTEDGAVLVASRLPYPFLATVQGLMGWLAQETKPTLYLRLAAWLERLALARCRIVTGESTFSTSYVRNHFPHLDVRRLDVVPDLMFHRCERRPEISPPRFAFVGKLGFAKGGDLLLRALDQFGSDFRLLVFGKRDEEMVRRLQGKISSSFWPRVEYKQQLTSEELAQEFARTTIMICPTRADTGPMSVKEAAVAGVPVVGSSVGGIPDYVVPGENGLLFPSGDLPALIGALRDALAHPLFGRGVVDQARLARLRLEMSPLRMASAFLLLYQEVAAQASKTR